MMFWWENMPEKEVVSWQTVFNRIEYWAWKNTPNPINAMERALTNIDLWIKDNEYITKEDRKELERQIHRIMTRVKAEIEKLIVEKKI
jgi:hypothetical protein